MAYSELDRSYKALKRLYEKLATHQSHRDFLNCCLIHDLVPRGLRIPILVADTPSGRDVTKRCHGAVLKELVEYHDEEVQKIQVEISSSEAQIRASDQDGYKTICSKVKHCFEIVTDRHFRRKHWQLRAMINRKLPLELQLPPSLLGPSTIAPHNMT